MAHITRLQIRNFLRISAVDITPNGHVITLGGKHGAGKTCVLKAIASLIHGKKAFEQKWEQIIKPIREGADRAELLGEIAELDLVIKRVYTANGERLTLTNRAGMSYPKPQEKLSQLVKARTFNPIVFAQSDGAKQTKMLMELAGLDFTDLDEEHDQLYEQRREVNRKLRDAEGALAGLPPRHEDAPDKEVSAAELMAELEKRQAQLDANEGERRTLARLANGVVDAEADTSEAQATIKQLEQQLKDAQTQLAEAQQCLSDAQREHAEWKKIVDALTDPDLDEVRRRIATADATNHKVRANRERAKQGTQIAELQEQSAGLTAKIDANRAKRQKRIAAANFPVEGLGFGKDGPTLNGIPLNQASHTEQHEVSAAVMAAANPTLALFLIPDASTLDADGLRFMAELADRHGCQIFEEDCRTTDPNAIILEDGRIKGAETEESAA